MLVGCLGVPASGKTTVAAEIFVQAKKAGLTAEFVVEVARQHIAQMRKSGRPVVLTDEDQRLISSLQEQSEQLMAMPETLTIADSSPLNAWLYMSPSAQEVFRDDFARLASHYALLVHVRGPVRQSSAAEADPNRVHGNDVQAHLLAQEEVLLRAVRETGVEVIEHRCGAPVDSLAFAIIDRFLARGP